MKVVAPLLLLSSISALHIEPMAGALPRSLASCRSGTYQNSTSNSCELCFKTCKECDMGGRTGCTSCNQGFYFIKSKKRCVANCEGFGLYTDEKNNRCVGCHPSCSLCFGPSSSQCKACAQDFVLSGTTCDESCIPQNSFFKEDNRVCHPCHKACSECTGSGINKCQGCYEPYYLKKSTCYLNKTRKAIMDGTYTPPMSWRLFALLIFLGLMGILLMILGIHLAYKAYLRYQLNKNRDYNVFREVELSKKEMRELSRWNLQVAKYENLVEIFASEHDLLAIFSQEIDTPIEMRTNKPFTVELDFFRYFEVEIIDKQDNFPIEVGITTADDITAPHDPRNDPYGFMIFINAERNLLRLYKEGEMQEKEGQFLFGKAGEAIGIAVKQINEESLDASVSLTINGQFEIVDFLIDLKIHSRQEYFPTLIVGGPCKLAVNVGGKKFRTFYNQLQKGLIQAESQEPQEQEEQAPEGTITEQGSPR